jgi:hypothetical protein
MERSPNHAPIVIYVKSGISRGEITLTTELIHLLIVPLPPFLPVHDAESTGIFDNRNLRKSRTLEKQVHLFNRPEFSEP